MPHDPALLAAFAPTGALRAAINLGNPILAGIDPATGQPAGVSIDLARALAERLGVVVELVVFDTAGKSVDAVTGERADVGFFAIDPIRGAGIAFTAPYVLIEGAYLVRGDSPITANEQVDRDSVRVVVGKGSAYDLHLTRELKAAEIVRAPSSPADHHEAARQQAQAGQARGVGFELLLHAGGDVEALRDEGVDDGRRRRRADDLGGLQLARQVQVVGTAFSDHDAHAGTIDLLIGRDG